MEFLRNFFDLEVALVLAALITGIIWGVYAFRRRRAGRSDDDSEPLLVEYSRTFFPVIVIVLVIRSFAFEPFRIPSSSMLPTLQTGDFIFVNKYVFGLRLPVLKTKILEVGEPERGDVVVFRLPSDNKTNYIKRVVGLPGDQIDYRNGVIFVNGERVPATLNGTYLTPEGRYDKALETLGDAEHDILLNPAMRNPRTQRIIRQSKDRVPLPTVVPAGHFFVMGDNRDNSKDSRFRQVGFIPETNLVGRATMIWFHLGKWHRIGDRIS